MKDKISEETILTRKPIGTICVRCLAKRGDDSKCVAWSKTYDRHFYNKVSMLETKIITRYLEK